MKLTLLLTFTALAAFAADPLTNADLEATVARWEEYVRPGRVMLTKSDAPFFLNSPDLVEIVDKAFRIGDREILIGLEKQGKALVETQSVSVRIIGTEGESSAEFRRLGIRHNTTTEQMRANFAALVQPNKKGKPAPITTEQHARLTAFPQHDITPWIEHEYARVRVLQGDHIGEEGWIKLSELKAPARD